jgi:uncharacterized protein (TIGR00730 family)
MMNSICVYCGSNAGKDPIYAQAARDTGRFLGESGCRLVYGGGRVGLMGVVADAAIEAGGQVTGIIPDFLHVREVAHGGVQDLQIVSSMHERKQLMADASDAFVALPGGIGTMEELFEIWTWAQLGRHKKPVGLLNINGYFDGLLEFLDNMTDEGFLMGKHRKMLLEASRIEDLIDGFESFTYPGVIASLERDQT